MGKLTASRYIYVPSIDRVHYIKAIQNTPKLNAYFYLSKCFRSFVAYLPCLKYSPNQHNTMLDSFRLHGVTSIKLVHPTPTIAADIIRWAMMMYITKLKSLIIYNYIWGILNSPSTLKTDYKAIELALFRTYLNFFAVRKKLHPRKHIRYYRCKKYHQALAKKSTKVML